MISRFQDRPYFFDSSKNVAGSANAFALAPKLALEFLNFFL